MTLTQLTPSLLSTARETNPVVHAEVVETLADIAASVAAVSPAERGGIAGNPLDPMLLPKPEQRSFVYPDWPTSTPGPRATPPPPGQRPHHRRTDQMVYACYDQELGQPCAPPVQSLKPRWHKPGTALPKIDLREHHAEAEALSRWLDDGGASD